MLAQDEVREAENVPLSNSTINKRTDDMSHDAEEVFSDKMKNKGFLSKLISQQISPIKVILKHL
jgi:cobalamin biosynthesis Co2+ chelatase CbiK